MIVLSYIELTKRINNVLILMKTKYKNKINHRRHSLSTRLKKRLSIHRIRVYLLFICIEKIVKPENISYFAVIYIFIMCNL